MTSGVVSYPKLPVRNDWGDGWETLTKEPDPVTPLAGAGGMFCIPDGRALQRERRGKGWDWLREGAGR
jgi:hypothetical protein